MIVEVDHPAVTGGLTLSYGADGAAGLDALGRVVDQKWTTGEGETETTVDEFTYGYDLSGNRAWRNVVPPGSGYDVYDEMYAYDGLNRLTTLGRGTLEGDYFTSVDSWQDWFLDALGNWDEFASDPDGPGGADPVWNEREHDAANQITSIPGGVTPAYDAAGNMVSGPKPGSPAGDGQTGQTYTYDAWNRLVKVEEWIWTDTNEDGVFQAGEKSTAVTVAEYQYDGLNRRIAKLVFDAPSDTWTRTDYYYNEDWQVLEERVATAVLAADKGVPATAPKVQYLWDPRYIDTPICRWRDADPNVAGLEEVLYYTTDANHNVTAVLGYVDHDNDPETPKVLRVVERYAYDAYGTVTVLNPDWSPATVNTSALGNEVLFTGHPLDGETGLYYARARYLQPTLGMWLNPDPEGYKDGMHLRQYCRSNPVGRVDALGTFGSGGQDLHRLSNRMSTCVTKNLVVAPQQWEKGEYLGAAWSSYKALLQYKACVTLDIVAGALDYIDPLYRYERGRRDYRANMRIMHGNSGDAASIAVLKNWPIIDLVFHGVECAYGEGIYGVNHGRPIELADRVAGIAGAVSAVTGMAAGTVKGMGCDLYITGGSDSLAPSGTLTFGVRSANPTAEGITFPQWRPGGSITQALEDGAYPRWFSLDAAEKASTIHGRYWLNRSLLAAPDEFAAGQVARMQAGYAPQARVWVRNLDRGALELRTVSKELHHSLGNRGVAPFDEPMYLREVWPWEHAKIDAWRKLGYEFVGFAD